MAYRDAKDVMLYFRGVADEDHDDGATGATGPALPTNTGTLTLTLDLGDLPFERRVFVSRRFCTRPHGYV